MHMKNRPRVLMKGNEAVIYGALLAGCHSYFGYPITPASEIAHAAAELFPKLGRVFLQAESEVAAINMVLGAAAAGKRCLTASSGPGISLKQEGVSYLAGSELPAVIVNIQRGGPGLGNIGPSQSDYNQIVKGGGHGDYFPIVLAPASAQEMCDLTMLAFDLADTYRGPVYVLSDGVIGQMIEAISLPEPVTPPPAPPWALPGEINGEPNHITSVYLEYDKLEAKNLELIATRDKVIANEQRAELFQTEDAEIILVGYGIVGRTLRNAVKALRQRGVKAGSLRPITLFPYPADALRKAAQNAKAILCVELCAGQMIDDIRLTMEGTKPIHGFFRMGGNIPSVDDIINETLKLA